MAYNAGTTSSPSTIDAVAGNKQIRQEDYNRNAIIAIKDEMYFSQMSGTMAMPKNFGKEVVKHRYLTILDDANNPGSGIGTDGTTVTEGNLYGSSRGIGFIEGRLPDLSEDSGRANKVTVSRKEVRGNIVNRGAFIEWNKDELNFDSDPKLLQHMTHEILRMANQVNEDILAIELINGAGVIYNAGTSSVDVVNTATTAVWAIGTTYAAGAPVSYTDGKVYRSIADGNVGNLPTDTTKWTYIGLSEAQILDESDLAAINYTSVPTLKDLIRIDTELDNNKCPRDTKVITGSKMIDTKTVASARFMFISPDVKMNFMEMTDLHGNPAFVPVERYQGESGDNKYIKSIHGEIGKVGPFRVVVHPKMVKYSDAIGGAVGAIGDGTGTSTGFRTDGTRYEVYPCLVVGSESFTHIGFEYGAGTSGKFKVTTTMPEQLRTRENPYAKFGMTTVEFWNGILIDRPEWIACYNISATY